MWALMEKAAVKFLAWRHRRNPWRVEFHQVDGVTVRVSKW